jgi:hypothetical protein
MKLELYKDAVLTCDVPEHRLRRGEGHPARSGQRHRRIRRIGRRAEQAEQEPASDAGAARQPEHGELLQYRERAPEEGPRETAGNRQGRLTPDRDRLR